MIVGAPVAQLDRASAFEAEGREFESLRARHLLLVPHVLTSFPSFLDFGTTRPLGTLVDFGRSNPMPTL